MGMDTIVTTYAVLALLSNQYCVSLLNEMKLSIDDADWVAANGQLQEFEENLACYRSAENELLYPRLLEATSVGQSRLNRLTRQQHEIARRQKRLAVSLSTRQAETARNDLQALIAILAAYGRSERRLFAKLPSDEALLKAFAMRLRHPLPDDDASFADLTQRKPLA